MMNNQVVEVLEYDGIGYKPLVDYGQWRVAFLRYIDELRPDAIRFMERHVETDEVFVLLEGQAVLFLGGNEATITEMTPLVMKPGRLYNVKRNAWHTVVLSGDATILLVENRNTGRENTEYCDLNPQQRAFLLETAQRQQPEWWL
ncbi:MAG: hypothetical protein ABWK53_07920 [Anaerolineales bacterium]